MLYPEFRQPLFLKLFCDGLKKAKKTVIPKEGYEGISEIMGFLINAINIELSKSNRLKFSANLKIVELALDLFISHLIETGKHNLPYEEAHLLLESGLSKFRLQPGILEELIKEGMQGIGPVRSLEQNLHSATTLKKDELIMLAVRVKVRTKLRC